MCSGQDGAVCRLARQDVTVANCWPQLHFQLFQMVYNYTRKSDRGSWNEADMVRAIEAIRKKEMGWALASKTFNIPATTLRRRVGNKNKIAVNTRKHLGRHENALNDEAEKAIISNILELESRFFGLTSRDVCTLAFKVAEAMKLNHPFNKAKQRAGLDWLRGFRRRNPQISLRRPEATSLARAEAFNKTQVERYFTDLERVVEQNAIHNIMIFNMDESAITTVQVPSKVFAKKGKKQVGALTSAERGVHTTVAICMSSGGTYIPPTIIFPRKKYNPVLYDAAPVGTLRLYNESGYMTGELFYKWMQHFINFVRPTPERKALLILDGHISHKSLEALQLAKERHVVLFCLPAHCTHRLQPLDVAFFGPLHKYYNQAVTEWLKANPGRPVTIYQVAQLFSQAYEKTATPAIAFSGFRATGIVPFNKNIFPEHMFLPSATTDVPMLSESSDQNVPINDNASQNNSVPSTSRVCRDLAIQENNNKEDITDVKLLVNKLSPKPQCIERKTAKRKSKKAAYQNVLTESPYLRELREKATSKKLMEERKSKRNLVKRKLVKEDDNDSADDMDANIESQSDEDDCACLYCNDLYSRSKSYEGWLKCQLCGMWCHSECAGVPKRAKQFICELCTD